MKRAILRGCVFCSAIIAGSGALRASVQAINEVQTTVLSGGATNVSFCGRSAGSSDGSIRCLFCGYVLVANPSLTPNLENTIRSDSIDSECFLNDEKITLGYNDGTGVGVLPEVTQDNRYAEADHSSAGEPISLISYSDGSSDGLQRELPPDDAALDKSCRDMLRSGRKEAPEKNTAGQERAEGNRNLLPELQATGLSGRDLILIYYCGGRLLFGLYFGACPTDDLFKASAPGLRPKPKLFIFSDGTNHRALLPHSSTETASASFWLKGTAVNRRNVAARFKGPREALWESYYDYYQFYIEWREKSFDPVPEPSAAALLLLSCLSLIHARARRRSSKSDPPDDHQ